jgi:hypothetical protein
MVRRVLHALAQAFVATDHSLGRLRKLRCVVRWMLAHQYSR